MTQPNRRTLLAAGGAFTALALLPLRARPQPSAWPATTRFIVPFSPGGAVDTMVRRLAELLAPQLGTVAVVENRAGASGLLAAKAVAKSPADGSTILYLHSGMVTLQAVSGRLDILGEFRPVTKITAGPHLLVVRGDSPYKTQAELISAIQSQPGKLNFGSGGVGSPPHLGFETMAERVPGGLKAAHIPYKSAPEAVVGLIGGDIDFTLALPGLAGEHLRSGKLRALSTTGAARLSFLPKLPTVAEAGIPGYLFDAWGGFAVPARTPDAVVARLHEATASAVAAPEFAELMARTGAVADLSPSPAAFAEQLRAAIPAEKALVMRLGIKPE